MPVSPLSSSWGENQTSEDNPREESLPVTSIPGDWTEGDTQDVHPGQETPQLTVGKL